MKSSDGSSNYWSQFSPELVAAMHANGLKVCAWQFVYGTNPVGEAELGARAVAAGADCLVIDAEGEYEGHYASAQKYIETLRAKIGPAYPVGLASFPYVDYHESFPYSVFLGANGAQFNAPQMYWKDIGTSVASVYAHTYEQNLIYGRPIAPLGQTYRETLGRRTGGFPLAGGRLWSEGPELVGLAGNAGGALGGAGRTAEHRADGALAGADLAVAGPGREGRPGAVDAGAPGQRGPRRRRRAASSTRRRRPTCSPSRRRMASRRAARPTRLHGRRCWHCRPWRWTGRKADRRGRKRRRRTPQGGPAGAAKWPTYGGGASTRGRRKRGLSTGSIARESRSHPQRARTTTAHAPKMRWNRGGASDTPPRGTIAGPQGRPSKKPSDVREPSEARTQ